MSRRPKLVGVTALIPTYLRDELKSAARINRRSTSGYVASILAAWYQKQTDYKELKDNGNEKISKDKIL